MISFRKINSKNIWDVTILSDGNNNEKYIDFSHNILIDALINNKMNNFYAIYYDNIAIGLIYFYKIKKTIWINSFMIDKKYQGKGYGKKSLIKLLNFIKSNYEFNKIELSTCNPIAMKLYQNIGFKKYNNKRCRKYFDKNNEYLFTLRNTSR